MSTEIDLLKPDFTKAWERFQENNPTLTHMERYNHETFEWVKCTAEVFYAFGRADGITDAADELNKILEPSA